MNGHATIRTSRGVADRRRDYSRATCRLSDSADLLPRTIFRSGWPHLHTHDEVTPFLGFDPVPLANFQPLFEFAGHALVSRSPARDPSPRLIKREPLEGPIETRRGARDAGRSTPSKWVPDSAHAMIGEALEHVRTDSRCAPWSTWVEARRDPRAFAFYPEAWVRAGRTSCARHTSARTSRTMSTSC